MEVQEGSNQNAGDQGGGSTLLSGAGDKPAAGADQGAGAAGGQAGAAGVAPDAAAKAATDAKAKADAAAAEAAKPLELKLPDTFKADDPFIAEYKTAAKAAGLDAAKAQQLFDVYAKSTSAQSQQAFKELDAHPEESIAVVTERHEKSWQAALKADKEFAKDFDANVAVARKAMAKFGSPELDAFLTKTRLGNHPAWVKFALKVGKAIGEDTVAGGSNAAGEEQSEKALLQDLYPKSYDAMTKERTS